MVGAKAAYPLCLLVVALGLSGCVTKENYNAQVLRTNNFQRLLAEEEKRSVELSTEIARLKDQMAGLEAKNKTLTAQLNDAKAQVVRSLEEVGRLQDEVKQARGGFSSAPALRGPSQEPPDRLGELQPAPAEKPDKKADKKKGKATAKVKEVEKIEPLLREPSQEPPDRLGELQAVPAEKPDKKVEKTKGKATAKVKEVEKAEPPAPAPPDESFFRYHKVKKGETLTSIAKQYKTDAQTLRELNDMASGDPIKPGDRLIVGQKQ